MRAVELVFSLAALALPACFFVSDFDGLSDGKPAAGGASSCTSTQFQLCTSVPAAPAGFTQVVDGKDDEFCAVPASIFQPQLGKFHSCGTEKNFVPAAKVSVATRLAWSPEALHLFARVEKDPSIPLVVDPVQLYKGDALEIFFANRAIPTGDLGTDQAVHLIIAPPSDEGGPGYLFSVAPFTAPWIAVRTTGGYDIELQIPWSMLGGPAPASSAGVVLNLGIDLTGPNGERYQSFVEYVSLDGSDAFCKDSSKPTPAENTLTWCGAKLQ